jgi:polysaccharide export outer membrane protein
MKRSLLILVTLLLTTSALAQEAASAAGSNTLVGARDVLDIRVAEDPNLNTKATVNPDGRISMELLGKVDVSGLTAAQIETKIRTLLEAKYMNRATVTVQITEFGSKPISVMGAVTRPGAIGTSEMMTLIQAITAAGGLATGYGKELYVLRTASNGLTEQIAIDIEDLLVNGNPDLNIPLAPNDVVNVPMDTPITIYVLGEVMKPGKAQFRRSQTPTLLQALADVGGPTDRASRKVIVKRRVNGKDTTMRVNYLDIVRGRKADIVLQDNDTIYISESLF